MEIKSLISILSGYFVSGRVEIEPIGSLSTCGEHFVLGRIETQSLISILEFSLNEHIIVNLSLNDSDNGKNLKILFNN